MTGSIDATTLDKVTRGLGKEEQTNTEDETEEELDTDGNAVGSSVGSVLGTVVDTRGEQETKSNGKLVSSNEGTTDFPRAL